MPIWEDFMLRVYKDPELIYEPGAFPRPEQGLSVQINCAKYNSKSVLAKYSNDSTKQDKSNVEVSEDEIF